MFTSIVVGTDGSETARDAVRRAVELASKFGAPLHIVTAIRTPALAFAAPEAALASAAAEWDAAARAEAKQMVEEAAKNAASSGVRAEGHVASGDPAEVLCAMAERLGAELIVVGNRGMTGAKRFLLGSVSNKVSHHAPCSVLIVHTTD